MVRRREGIREVVTLGDSMGGFMALVLPQLTAVDCVIAFSPQYSLHPDHVPEETRWGFWRDRFPGYRHETVEPIDPEAQRIFVFHGDSPDEAIHWRRFPKAEGLHHFIVRGAKHDLAADFKEKRLLGKLFRNAVAGRARRVRRVLEEAFEVSRREDLPQLVFSSVRS